MDTRSSSGTPRHPDDPREVIQAFVTAVNDQDWPAVETLVADTFVRHSDAGGDLDGRDALIDLLEGEYRTFPDAHETLEATIAEGSLVAARHLFTGTQEGPLGEHPPTGQAMSARYLAMYRVVDGQIVEAWAEWDNLTGQAQLGLTDH